MTAGHYRADRRDVEFVLFELLDRSAALAADEWGVTDARAALAAVEELAVGALAASFTAADRDPPVLDPGTGTVRVSDPFRRSFEAYRGSEWWRFDLPAALGGPPVPPSLRWAVQEMVLGANPALHMYACGYVFAAVLHEVGDPQQRRLAELMVDRGWGASMALTEDQAGSDVGAVRTRAVEQPDGSWHLDGVKRFVTNGDHDLAETIVHFVLARPDGAGAGAGTKGLSLFVVPKYHVDLGTGALGERNGVRPTRLEDKLGLRASATCELTFGLPGAPAVGRLVGGTHDGIAQVFRLVQDARMMVGTKAMATLSTAYLNAAEHARTRVQGRDLSRRGDRGAPAVPIAAHPDVDRMLRTGQVYAEGLRALTLLAAAALDDGDATRAALLLPVVKGFGAERANEQVATMMQVVGGAAYLRDLPYEQYLRDVRVDTLYEGTTGIQSLDLFFRQVVRDDGAALDGLLDEVAATPSLDAAAEDVRAIATAMRRWVAADDARRAGAHTHRLLLALGDLLVCWLLVRSADLAAAALERGGLSPEDESFRRGKLRTAEHALSTLVPTVAAARRIVEAAPPGPAHPLRPAGRVPSGA